MTTYNLTPSSGQPFNPYPQAHLQFNSPHQPYSQSSTLPLRQNTLFIDPACSNNFSLGLQPFQTSMQFSGSSAHVAYPSPHIHPAAASGNFSQYVQPHAQPQGFTQRRLQIDTSYKTEQKMRQKTAWCIIYFDNISENSIPLSDDGTPLYTSDTLKSLKAFATAKNGIELWASCEMLSEKQKAVINKECGQIFEPKINNFLPTPPVSATVTSVAMSAVPVAAAALAHIPTRRSSPAAACTPSPIAMNTSLHNSPVAAEEEADPQTPYAMNDYSSSFYAYPANASYAAAASASSAAAAGPQSPDPMYILPDIEVYRAQTLRAKSDEVMKTIIDARKQDINSQKNEPSQSPNSAKKRKANGQNLEAEEKEIAQLRMAAQLKAVAAREHKKASSAAASASASAASSSSSPNKRALLSNIVANIKAYDKYEFKATKQFASDFYEKEMGTTGYKDLLIAILRKAKKDGDLADHHPLINTANKLHEIRLHENSGPRYYYTIVPSLTKRKTLVFIGHSLKDNQGQIIKDQIKPRYKTLAEGKFKEVFPLNTTPFSAEGSPQHSEFPIRNQ